MRVKQRPDPIYGEVDADQFIDDGKAEEWMGRHVFRDTKGGYVEVGGLGDGYLRSGDFLITLGDGRFEGMTSEEFYKKYDREPPKPAAAPVAKAEAAQLAKDEKAADKFGATQVKK